MLISSPTLLLLPLLLRHGRRVNRLTVLVLLIRQPQRPAKTQRLEHSWNFGTDLTQIGCEQHHHNLYSPLMTVGFWHPLQHDWLVSFPLMTSLARSINLKVWALTLLNLEYFPLGIQFILVVILYFVLRLFKSTQYKSTGQTNLQYEMNLCLLWHIYSICLYLFAGGEIRTFSRVWKTCSSTRLQREKRRFPSINFSQWVSKSSLQQWCHETGSWSVSCSKYSLFYFRHLKPLDLALEIPGWGSVWKPSKSLWRTRKTASRWTVTFSRSRTHRVSCLILLLPFSWVSAVQCALKFLFLSFAAFIFAFSVCIYWPCQMTTQKEIWVASY